jgi:two-component system sensor histidine kinase HydH
MADLGIQELERYIGFDDQDAANVRALAAHATVLIPPIVDRFYHQIQQTAGTRAILTGGPAQMSRLRQSLVEWLGGLFGGSYGDEFWAARAEIGRVHVRVGLPQHYMFAAMQVIWEELERGIRQAHLADASAKLVSLHKLVMLELAVMLESYKDSYSEQIRHGEREAIQERLTEAEQLARIGQLAASLAHEIKNPLAGISGAIQVIRDSMKPDELHRPILDEVLRQVGRLDGTVKDLLVYARPRPPRFRRCNLDLLIARTLTVLREQPEMQRIRFEYVNSQHLPPIDADEHQLDQLLTNLLLNAAQASPKDGLVRLTASAQGDGIRLTVEDRGHGMDEEVRRRAMEPFFTTKAKGTGLGLPICRKIVETHGGSIAVRSAVGQGTEVAVNLPGHPPASGGNPDDDSRARCRG